MNEVLNGKLVVSPCDIPKLQGPSGNRVVVEMLGPCFEVAYFVQDILVELPLEKAVRCWWVPNS